MCRQRPLRDEPLATDCVTCMYSTCHPGRLPIFRALTSSFHHYVHFRAAAAMLPPRLSASLGVITANEGVVVEGDDVDARLAEELMRVHAAGARGVS